MADTGSRDEFFSNIRRALGRATTSSSLIPSHVTALSKDFSVVQSRVQMIREEIATKADELMAQLQISATEAGWRVERVVSDREAARFIESLVRETDVGSMLRSAHHVLDRLDLENALSGMGIALDLMAIGNETDPLDRTLKRASLRRQATEADMGITGVEYAIAETGSCVLASKRGVSRLVSLLPPVHVAVVERGQVLPSLDELFTLNRLEFLEGEHIRYMNIISGPSRSADIEYTLVKGVHGPGEVHMVLLG